MGKTKLVKNKDHELYHVWCSMRQRCLSPTHKAYANYGGRGITICERWNDFENFISDLPDRPDGHSIDRIDNDLGYFKENVRWATAKQQLQNRRPSKPWGTNAKPIKRGRKIVTHCRRGHEYTPETTGFSKSGTRHCKTCHAINSFRHHHSVKASEFTDSEILQMRAVQNMNKAECKKGHSFTAENTLFRADGRRCKTCQQASSRKSEIKRQAINKELETK